MLRNYDICTKLLFLIDEEDAPAESKGERGARVVQTRLRDMYLDVRLLITPVVVSFCSTSAKIDTIPEFETDGSQL